VPLPSDTHRKPITSIAAVLLPFVTYLLTPAYKDNLRTSFAVFTFYCDACVVLQTTTEEAINTETFIAGDQLGLL
jgi:hypothetical protein